MASTLKPQSKGDSAAQDKQLLAKLSRLWEPWQRKNLEIRHKTGVLLNKRLDDPGVRQDYGDKIIDKVCRQIGVDKSDVSRMRWFAYKFPTLKKLYEKHPKVKTWSAVKELLGKKGKPKNPQQSSRSKGSQVTVRGVLSSLKAVTKQLEKLAKAGLGADRDRILQAVSKVMGAICQPSRTKKSAA